MAAPRVRRSLGSFSYNTSAAHDPGGVVASGGGCARVDFALDYVFSFARPLRIVLSLLMGLSLAILVFCVICAVVTGTPSVVLLAHRVERRFCEVCW